MMGAITALRKVMALADAHNVAVMVHTFYDGPGLLASIHATAALGDDGSMIEGRYFDMEADLYRGALRPRDGHIDMPPGSGLGLEPDPAVIARYRID